MSWKVRLVLLSALSLVFCAVMSEAQSTPGEVSTSNPAQEPSQKSIVVPARVAALLRPVLDELKSYRSQSSRDEHQLDEQLRILTETKGQSADEAVAVLLCFDMGESQEEADAVIARGRRMLPYIKKYRDSTPKIPGSSYGDLLKTPHRKDVAFQGVVNAIKHGWKSTADNPEG